MSAKTKAIILGGLAMGVILSIPLISRGWFIWAFLGGFLSASILVRSSRNRVEISDGVFVGSLAGVLGGIVSFLGYPVFHVLSVFPNSSANSAGIGAVGGLFFERVILLLIPTILLALLGGLIGTILIQNAGQK